MQRLFCQGGGCTAKLGPGALAHILERLEKPKHPDQNLLVGFDSNDDAAVYQVSDDTAIVQTLDFFPPLVEDPYLFGRIAATNALSDLYAMGAVPHTALNIVAFPEKEDLNVLGHIMRGGNDAVMEAKATLVGGHSIFDDTIKYGLSCMGTVHPDRILQNNTPQEGDVLLLTKPLGIGIAMNADRKKDCPADTFDAAIASMTTLNVFGLEAQTLGAHAVTDVTGFGLANHLLEMVGSEYCAELDAEALPLLPHLMDLINRGYITGGGKRNRANAEAHIVWRGHAEFEEVLFDPQTSGGLLISVSRQDLSKMQQRLRTLDLYGEMIGHIKARTEGAKIIVH